MDKQQLLDLRQKIVDLAMPIVMDNDGSPEEKASLMLDIIRAGSADNSLYSKTFEAIQKIEDKDVKVGLLLDFLSEVESGIENIDSQSKSANA